MSRHCDDRAVQSRQKPAGKILKCMQLNFRKSDTTWILAQQELSGNKTQPDIVLIQDPPSSVLGGKNIFNGFRLFQAPGRGQGLGQVAIAIQRSIQARVLRPFGPRVLAVEVVDNEGPIIAISAYVRYSTGEGIDDLDAAVKWAKNKCPRIVIGMDGNGHSSWWGPDTVDSNPVGKMIEEFVVDHNLEIINDCQSPPTFVSDMGDSTWIDITMATRSMAVACKNWRVDSRFFTGSDHRPIFFDIDCTPLHTASFMRKNWKQTNWTQFAASVRDGCQRVGLMSNDGSDIQARVESGPIEDHVRKLIEVIQEAIGEHVPEKKISWASKPWWSPEVESSRREMRRLLHRAERLGTAHDWGLYRRARRRFTSIVRQAKAQSWRDFCTSVNRTDMWSNVQRILKPHKRLHIGDLKTPQGDWVSEDETKAEVLAERFFPKGPSSTDFKRKIACYNNEVNQWISGTPATFPSVTVQEVSHKLLEMRAFAAPGPDGIITKCLQEAQESVVPILLGLFQRMLVEGVHPRMWRTAKVIPVPKPGADTHVAKGYRPIALISVLSKILEGVVKDRLSFILESGNCLSDSQQGFRQTRSTELAIWRFVSSASLALKMRRRCVAVALDIQSAYDTVNHTALLWKMKQKGVPPYLVAWVRSFLDERMAELVINETTFEFHVQTGVPQGSPLSPVLFILYIDDLIQSLEKVVRIQAFADDILLWDLWDAKGTCPPKVQQALALVEEWSAEWGLQFNVNKCQAIDITQLRDVGVLELRLHNEVVPQVQEFRYLGIWIDSKLRWGRQIRETEGACMTRIRALRSLCATYWGLHPRVTEVLVKAIVFPRLWYGVCAWGSVVRFLKHLAAIDRVLRMSAVVTLGLLRTTSTSRAVAVCGWLSADLAIRYALLRFIIRQRCYGRDDLLDRDFTSGVNQVISTIDISRRIVARFRHTGEDAELGWTHLDRIHHEIFPPWMEGQPVSIRFLMRETAEEELRVAQFQRVGVWIYTDGSVQEGRGGAAAIFEDAGGPFGEVELSRVSGPLQSSTDAELTAIGLALSHLMSRTDWSQAFIVSDSQAALLQLHGVKWNRAKGSTLQVYRQIQALRESGQRVEFWWAPGHSGIAGNERADAVARTATTSGHLRTGDWWVSRSMLESLASRWFQTQAQSQERAVMGDVVGHTEEVIIRTNLQWTRLLPSRFMIAQVAQFLTGHYPTRTYLHRFGLQSSPMCEHCAVPESREHVLLFCPRWSFERQRTRQWMEDEERRPSEHTTDVDWTWEYLVGTDRGRLWLGRFLVSIRPRWSMRDQFHSNGASGSSDQE